MNPVGSRDNPKGLRLTDLDYLRNVQYKGPENLLARIALHARFSQNLHQWSAWVFDHLLERLPPVAQVLEVGAGPGTLWTSNRARVPSGWHIRLTDLSAGMIKAARQALRSNSRFEFAVAGAMQVEAPDNRYDAVLAHHMLFHVPDRMRALREFRRVLKTGGLLSVALNGRAHMKEVYSLAETLPGLRVVRARGPHETFDLEEAPPEIETVFGKSEVVRHEDALFVTEARPLLAYFVSDMRFAVDDAAAVERALSARIAREGGIRFEKSAGLIFAHKLRRRIPGSVPVGPGAKAGRKIG